MTQMLCNSKINEIEAKVVVQKDEIQFIIQESEKRHKKMTE